MKSAVELNGLSLKFVLLCHEDIDKNSRKDNRCIYAETTLKTYVKLKSVKVVFSISTRNYSNVLLHTIQKQDMYKYGLHLKKRLSFPIEYGNRFDCVNASLLK